jgi:hypothetical protein
MERAGDASAPVHELVLPSGVKVRGECDTLM